MKPPHPNNRSDGRNLNFSGKNFQLLTKDGFRPSGSIVNMKKKSNPGFVGMDDKRIDGLCENAGIQVSVQKSRPPVLYESGGLHGVYDSASATHLQGKVDMAVDGGKSGDDQFVVNKDLNEEVLQNQKGFDNPNSHSVNYGPGGSVLAQEDCLRPGVKNATGDISGEVKSDQKPKLWSEVINSKEGHQRLKFEYHTPELVNGKIVIRPPLKVDIDGRKPWENCLVGYFFERRVAYHVMEYNAKRKWAKRGLLEVIMNDDGFFFFKFATENDLLEILEEGVCMVDGKPLILQRWYPQIVLSKDVPKFIPLWVKIFNIPLQYWNLAGLSRIGSGVGNIVMADSMTERMCRDASGRLSFAKLLIEVEANKELPDQLFVVIPNEEGKEPVEVSLRVEYPWRPTWCSHCSIFGHSNRVCSALIKKQAEEKKLVIENNSKPKDDEQEEGFIVVQRKGKGKMEVAENSSRNFKKGASGKRPFYYVNKGVVIKEPRPHVGTNKVEHFKSVGDQGKLMEAGYHGVKPGGRMEANQEAKSSVVIQNRFDLLSDDNSVEKPLIDRVGADPGFVYSGDLGGDRTVGEELKVENQKSAVELFDERVKEFVCSGSNLSKDELCQLENKIEEREKRQFSRETEDLIDCTTNRERDYNSEPDDTDLFMLKGISNQGKDGEIREWETEEEGILE